MPVTAAVGSIVGQGIATRGGLRPVATVGLTLTGLGCLFLTQVSVDGSYFGDIFFGLLLFGPGLGATYVAGSIGSLAGATEADAGLASGLANSSFQIGGAIGVAIVSTVAVSQADGSDPLAALTNGFQSAFATAIIFAAVGLLAAIAVLGKLRLPTAAPQATRRGVRRRSPAAVCVRGGRAVASAGPLRQTVEHHLDRGSPGWPARVGRGSRGCRPPSATP